MPSTLTIFAKSRVWRAFASSTANAVPPAAFLPADFTEAPQWTRFLADWVDAGQAVPRIGYQGMGAGREIVALHEGLLLRSVFQPIYRPSPLSPVAFEALI